MARETADIVIVGGGIIGLSIAHQVGRRSGTRIVVLEKGAGLGEGSTGSSASITRQRYTQSASIGISRDANRVFANWAEFTGLSRPVAALRPIGVLWIMPTSRAAAAAEAIRLLAEGVDVVALSAADMRDRFPALSTCSKPFDLTGEEPHDCTEGDGFLLERGSGYFDATDALEDLAEAVRIAGVDVRFRSEVASVLSTGSRTIGVTTADGTEIHAGTVINAAGPWCNRINRFAGLDLAWDLVPTRIQVIYRDLPPQVPRPLPVVLDVSSGTYFRPESGDQQLLMGSTLEEDEREVVDPDDYNARADRTFIDTKIHAFHHRVPSLPHRGTLDGMAGMYTINRQDVHPVIGPTPVDGFVIANGFSGHGFKEAPMVGSMLAQWLTGERASFDTDVPMAFYSIDRDPISTADKNVLA